MSAEQPPRLHSGLAFEDQVPGRRFRTQRRTVSEFDLMSFLATFGFTDELLLDAAASAAAGYPGRLVPGTMTLALAEGLVVASGALAGTGMALLKVDTEIKAPVVVGDTLEVWVEVLSARATSAGGRGIVTTRNEVRNQRGEVVLVFQPTRMIRARDHVNKS
jgi:acyl dehydratase